jgi:hypothetical protein
MELVPSKPKNDEAAKEQTRMTMTLRHNLALKLPKMTTPWLFDRCISWVCFADENLRCRERE